MESTRNKLISILAKNKDSFFSGQALSEELNISRSAVWKHMNELKKDGYQIEAQSNKGYRITGFPDKISENTLQWGLDTTWAGKKLIHKETVTSTQYIAHETARNHAPHGTVVIADEQKEGKGRMNRSWQSAKEKGLWFSIILRPDIQPQLAPQLTLLTATVLADVLKKHTGIEPMIKWPNDILINEKKCAGILTELQAEQDRIQYIVIGIGLNINQEEKELAAIPKQATSLAVETGKSWSLKALFQAILTSFEKTYESYMASGFPEVKKTWESYGFKIGQKIQVKTRQQTGEAFFKGISDDGALVIENEDGELNKLYSAEIEWFENKEDKPC
jgi:BirA family biotin operon repressor/biotin-[acetyl-CoA-carboxylase] ligase